MDEIIEIYDQEDGEEISTWFNPIDHTYGKPGQEGYVPIPRSVFNEVFERYHLIRHMGSFFALDKEDRTWTEFQYQSGLATFFWDRLRKRLVEENLSYDENYERFVTSLLGAMKRGSDD